MVCMANCMVMVAAIVAEDLEGDQSEDNNEAGLHLGEDDQRGVVYQTDLDEDDKTSCLLDREVLQALTLSNAIYAKIFERGCCFSDKFCNIKDILTHWGPL